MIEIPEKTTYDQNLEIINDYACLKEGIAYLNLGVCSVSKAKIISQKLMNYNQSFRICFVKKNDQYVHILEHEVTETEYIIDKDGRKWQRIYDK